MATLSSILKLNVLCCLQTNEKLQINRKIIIQRLTFVIVLNMILQKSTVRFILTTVRNHEWKKKSSITVQNNFKFKKLTENSARPNFHDALPENSEVTPSYRDTVVSSDLIQQSEKREKLLRKQRRPALSYQGELLYGVHPVYLALKQQKRQFHHIFMKDFFSIPNSSDTRNLKDEIKRLVASLRVETTCVTTRDLNYLAPDAVHQGFCLDASAYPLREYEETNRIKLDSSCSNLPVWLVLDQIQDPMNMGAILRSAYYFGVDKVFLTADYSCKLSPTVSKASSGALEILDIYKIDDLASFLKNRKLDGWDIVSTLAYKPHEEKCLEVEKPSLNLCNYNVTRPTILILGNESKGITSSVLELCDCLLCIYPPKQLHVGVDSLNVSVATGVLLYHMLYSKKPQAS